MQGALNSFSLLASWWYCTEISLLIYWLKSIKNRAISVSVPQTPFWTWRDSHRNGPDFRGCVASRQPKPIYSAYPHLLLCIFNCELKLFMPSRLLQWNLYFHKTVSQMKRKKRNQGWRWREGRIWLVVTSSAVLSLLQEDHSIHSHDAATSARYGACISNFAAVCFLVSWMDVHTKHEILQASSYSLPLK